MGNSISLEQRDQIQDTICEIFSRDFPIFNLGERCGHTGYIDFIHHEELGKNNVVKGFDIHGRCFLVFKCEIAGDPTARYCITLFQRYREDDIFYMFSENLNKQLFLTEGGVRIDQLNAVNELFESRSIEVDYDRSKLLRVIYPNFGDQEKTNIVIQLGWSCDIMATQN